MVYYGSVKTEAMVFHNDNDVHEMHYVELVRPCEDGVFYVRTCCDSEWEWAFYYTASNYEMIKHVIMDVMFECNNMTELMLELDIMFEENFAEIVAYDDDDDCDCDTGCNHCRCKLN